MFLNISHSSQEISCARAFIKKGNFIKKEALAHVLFSCEFCEIFQNTFLEEYL